MRKLETLLDNLRNAGHTVVCEKAIIPPDVIPGLFGIHQLPSPSKAYVHCVGFMIQVDGADFYLFYDVVKDTYSFYHKRDSCSEGVRLIFSDFCSGNGEMAPTYFLFTVDKGSDEFNYVSRWGTRGDDCAEEAKRFVESGRATNAVVCKSVKEFYAKTQITVRVKEWT